MEQYATTTQCRREFILEYFGEILSSIDSNNNNSNNNNNNNNNNNTNTTNKSNTQNKYKCNNCDNCQATQQERDFSKEAYLFLKAMELSGQKFGYGVSYLDNIISSPVIYIDLVLSVFITSVSWICTYILLGYCGYPARKTKEEDYSLPQTPCICKRNG